MKNLGAPNPAFAGDAGDADAGLRVLMAQAADTDGYARAVAGLCLSRLLLAIAPDPEGDLSAVQVTAPDGRTGLLAFTGLDSFQEWNALARPVPCTLDDLAATAVEVAAEALILDIAGPVPLVIEGELLSELAAGRRLVELPEGGFGWLFVERPGADSPADQPC